MLNTVYTAHWLLYYVYNWKITIFYDLFMHASMHPPHSTSTLLSCLVLREEPTTRIFQNVNGRIRLETRKWNFLFMTMHFFICSFYVLYFIKYTQLIHTFIHWIGIETKSSACHHDFFHQFFWHFKKSFKDFWKKFSPFWQPKHW